MKLGRNKENLLSYFNYLYYTSSILVIQAIFQLFLIFFLAKKRTNKMLINVDNIYCYSILFTIFLHYIHIFFLSHASIIFFSRISKQDFFVTNLFYIYIYSKIFFKKLKMAFGSFFVKKKI